ncbi:hypothetical protein SmJEL517_g02528 [Synchytrium microbalum]|uniref:Uncharacterized protein n=1 Tax=Synchytrium microbalum TaxID=1806994 RepID=A0A507C5C7_9FUNG|nr:uncharacterized protein SmJEL517_g02528 [Synchytrium microbalum]TPX34882.1 hypothetical protein SmJEL517_g02528 [Synchytrium microbalum]
MKKCLDIPFPTPPGHEKIMFFQGAAPDVSSSNLTESTTANSGDVCNWKDERNPVFTARYQVLGVVRQQGIAAAVESTVGSGSGASSGLRKPDGLRGSMT